MLVTLRDDDVAQSCTALQFATGQTGDDTRALNPLRNQ